MRISCSSSWYCARRNNVTGDTPQARTGEPRLVSVPGQRCPAGGKGRTPPYSPMIDACRPAETEKGPEYRWVSLMSLLRGSVAWQQLALPLSVSTRDPGSRLLIALVTPAGSNWCQP